jgi:Conserved hypothetical protein 2217 (DUF2460)
MSAFPKLKTGAVAQYPASRALVHATEVVRFLDGTEQRYRVREAAARRWVVRLDLLDETEIARLQEFFIAEQGRFGSFSFEDPWDGSVHANCSLERDEFEFELLGEARGRLVLVVRENDD